MDRDHIGTPVEPIESSPQRQNDLLTAEALRDLHRNEQRFTQSLREQLDKARKDKATLEADLESRAKAFQATLDQLQSNPSGENKSVEMLMDISDLDVLRAETKKLHEKCAAQEARIKKLEFDLEMEQGHVNILRHDNQMLRQMTVNMTALAEQEEEYISNKLLKRISGLKKEKGELLVQVEQEEEYLTNMLQKKLSQLQKEKVDLENALEQEQEYIVNKLQKQLDSLRLQQTLSQSPSRSSSFMMDTGTAPGSLPMSPAVTGAGTSPSLSAKKWIPSHSPGASGDLPPTGLIEVLKAEVASLKNKTIDMEKEFLNKYHQCNKYKTELIHFRKEHNMSTDDIPADEGIPAVFRSVPPSPGRPVRGKRSTSTSSQRSITSDKASGIPPLQLDNSISTSTTSSIQQEHHISSHSSVAPQAIPDTNRSRSDSVSSSSSSVPRRDISSRRISGGMFGLHSPPPQHPPHP
ncbi:hypothetical protein EC973_003745 [Apophysomyces ossiformis]|uniref:Coiled-coil domain-containing protein 6 n=1 Tax=Apophysomyces ossiformis TaxID=679940 RepID=A0A8H7BHN4_9FUNG|nr:hypothetical protein EC973_003745 [Apophysomyces ossiformis]